MRSKPRELQLFGVDGRTGRYALPPIRAADLEIAVRCLKAPAALARAARRSLATFACEHISWPRRGVAPSSHRPQGAFSGPDVPLSDWEPAERGWGVVFAAGDPQTPALRAALGPLFALRRAQAGSVSEQRFRILEYRPGELLFDFRRRYRAPAGILDPRRIPGYLLLVGGPLAIPFDFQTELAAQDYAVGRLHLETVEDYARYAERVVEAETGGKASGTRRVAFFAPEHPDDPLSRESSLYLATPLAESCAIPGDDWTVERIVGPEATKERLSGLLGRETPPAILFTAGHGALFRCGDRRQAGHQGALVCADWLGPRNAAISRRDYFGADDLTDDFDLGGMIAFHFACCSLGVPAQNDLGLAGLPIPGRLAPEDLIARLPQRMLARGALAAIGHLDLVFAYSFREETDGREETVEPPPLYDRCLKGLLRGLPIGEAMSAFRACYQARLVERAELERRRDGGRPIAAETLWEVEAACHDARYYAIFGDPAVRPASAGSAGV